VAIQRCPKGSCGGAICKHGRCTQHRPCPKCTPQELAKLQAQLNEAVALAYDEDMAVYGYDRG
jgi:hypothetical protein